MTYANYEFTGYAEADLYAGDIAKGVSFTIPSTATVCISVSDNDVFLSGDSVHDENANDHTGQNASIEGASGELGNGGQIYAEKYWWVQDQHGEWYQMVEIEQEGGNGDYFTFYNGDGYGTPPAGAILTVHDCCNVTTDFLDYKCLDGGIKWELDADCTYTVEAEDFQAWNFKTVHGDNASGGELVKITANDASLKTSFGGESGRYDVKICVQDETDGVSKIEMFVDGHHVGNIMLDRQSNGGGSNDGHFSEFVIDNVNIQQGQKVEFRAWKDGGEFVRIDKIQFVQDKTGWIKGRLTYDEDCNDNEWNDTTGSWDPGVAGATVELIDLHGNVVATSVTDHYGNYMFDVDAGDYRVRFPKPAGYEFSAKDSGVDEHFDSDANPDGTTDVIHLSAGQSIHDVDAGLKIDNDAPDAKDDCYFYCETEDGGVYDGNNLLSNDTDADGDHLFVTAVNGQGIGDGKWIQLEKGAVFVNKDGRIDFDAKGEFDYLAKGETAEVSFMYDISDGNGGQDWAKAVIKVEGKNEPGSISGRVWCDTDCDGLEGKTEIGCVDKVVAHETFDHVQGWWDVWTMDDDRGNPYLGGFGHTGRTTEDTGKNFHLPANTKGACIEFDFLEIDSWDGEKFFVFIDGHRVNLGSFRHNHDEGDRSFDAGNGIHVEIVSQGDGKTDLGYKNDHWSDQVHKVKITVDTSAADLRIGFGSSLNQDKHDESWGVDNLKITASVEETVTVAEPPKEGVLVELLDAHGNPVLDGNGAAITTLTAADGTYTFDNVPSGDYTVRFTAPDGTVFTTQDVGHDDTIDSDANAHGVTGVIHLGDGTHISDVDAGVKDAPASISGRYFCDVDGDATENDGNGGVEPGVAGATVWLLAAGGSIVATTTTANDGSYTFDGLNAGRYAVRFEDPNDVADQEGKTFVAANVGDAATDSDVTDVGGAGNGNTDFFDVATGDTVTDVDAGIADPVNASISGRYFCDENNNDLDDGEIGVVEASVFLYDAAGNLLKTTFTELDGSYTFTDLAAGDYEVRFEADSSKTFVDANVGDDDTIDSDVIGTDAAGNGSTGVISLGAGEQKADVDAGIEVPLDLPPCTFRLLNHPDGAVADPGYGLRLDNLLGHGVYTFDFEAPGADMFAHLEGNTLRIFGTAFGGKDVGNTYEDPGFFEIDFSYTIERAPGDDDFLVDASNAMTNTGTITQLDDNGDPIQTFDLTDKAGTHPFSFRFGDTDDDTGHRGFDGKSGWGWMLVDGQDKPGAQDWLFAVGEKVEGGTVEGRVWCDTDCDGLEGKTEIGCVDKVVAHETFDHVQGWWDVWTMDDDRGNPYLGGFGHTGRTTEDTGKNFHLPANTKGACIEFDFLEIDSWDGEKFFVFIDGHRVNLGSFRHNHDEGDRSFDAGNGIHVEIVSQGDGKTDLGYMNDHWSDQVHKVKITVDTSAADLRIGFGSSLNQEKWDESWGVDNLKITASVEETVTVTEPPKEGVIVTLLNVDGTEVLDGNGVAITTMTAADGTYSFENVPAGEYRVKFTNPDGTVFTFQNVGSDDTIDSDAAANGVSDVFTIALGGTTSDVDAGLKDAPASISGRYFDDTDRDATENDGNGGVEPGVADATVWLVKQGEGVVASTTTEPDGSYSFDDVAPGTYSVRFEDPTDVPGQDGKIFVASDVGDDATDSDVTSVGGAGNGNTDFFAVAAGDAITDVDAGIASRFRPCDDPDAVLIDFEILSAGDLASDQYPGVTISGDENDANDPAGDNDAMVFDSANPTGGDTDLATTTQGNVLIITEDDDANDPDDSGKGGTLTFTFDNPSFIYDLKVIDTEEPGSIDLFDDQGTLLGTVTLPAVGDGGLEQVLIDMDNVSSMVVTFGGSGALDDICYVPGEPQEGAIEGRVFIDLDGNALDDAEPGLGGITVTLLDTAGAPILDGGSPITAVTQADGSYTFGTVAAGNYRVQVDADPAGRVFVTQNVDGNMSDDIDSDVDAAGISDVFTVVAGGTTSDIDAGVEDPADASISGRAFIDTNDDSLEIDGNGDPEAGLGGILVTLLNGDGSTTSTTTTTGLDGSYTFTDLAAGDYIVAFGPDAGGRVLVDQDAGDDAIDSDANPLNGQTDVLTVAISGGLTDVDAGYEDPRTSVIEGRAFVDSNDDSLDDDGTGAAEAGLGGILVQLFNEDGSTATDSAGNPITATTSPDGSYVLVGMTGGRYTVAFGADALGRQFVTQDVDGDVSDDIDSDVDASGATNVFDVAIGQTVSDIDAGYEGFGSISGRYFCDVDGDGIDDGEFNGDPGLEDALIELVDAAGNVVDTFTTEEEGGGEYRFDNVLAGTYTVRFQAPDAGKVFTDANVGETGGVDAADDSDVIDTDVAGRGLTGPITVDPGASVVDADAGVKPNLGSVSGRFFHDTNRNGLDDGNLTEFGVEEATIELVNDQGVVVQTFVTEEEGDGTYRFDNVLAGNYQVRFVNPTNKVFTDQDVGQVGATDVANDSDADANGLTAAFAVVGGLETPDIDAGLKTTTAIINGTITTTTQVVFVLDHSAASFSGNVAGVGDLNGDGTGGQIIDAMLQQIVDRALAEDGNGTQIYADNQTFGLILSGYDIDVEQPVTTGLVPPLLTRGQIADAVLNGTVTDLFSPEFSQAPLAGSEIDLAAGLQEAGNYLQGIGTGGADVDEVIVLTAQDGFDLVLPSDDGPQGIFTIGGELATDGMDTSIVPAGVQAAIDRLTNPEGTPGGGFDANLDVVYIDTGLVNVDTFLLDAIDDDGAADQVAVADLDNAGSLGLDSFMASPAEMITALRILDDGVLVSGISVDDLVFQTTDGSFDFAPVEIAADVGSVIDVEFDIDTDNDGVGDRTVAWSDFGFAIPGGIATRTVDFDGETVEFDINTLFGSA